MATTLYPFRYRHPLTGKWVCARYKATREQLMARYEVWEITGPPEIRESGDGAYFNPARTAQALTLQQHGVERQPQLSEGERLLVLLFLRRYVTYCARRSRWTQLRHAAQLYRRIELTA